MADDVLHQINEASVGSEGAAYIAPNGLKIPASPPQKVTTTLNWAMPSASSVLDNRLVKPV